VATARQLARGVPAGGPERVARIRWVKEKDGQWRIDLLEAINLIQGHFDDTHRLDFPDVSEETLAHGIVETFTQQKLRSRHFLPMTAAVADLEQDAIEPSLLEDGHAIPHLGSPPAIELVQRGDPPYRKLRRSLRKGNTQRLTVVIKNDVQSRIGDRTSPTTRTPTLTYEITANTRTVDRAGKARLDLRILGLQVDADQPAPTQLAAQLKGMAESVRGVQGTMTTDTRGFVEAVQFSPDPRAGSGAEEVAKLLLSSIRKIQSVLPEEAVGPGARWVVRETVVEAGVTAVQATTYELAAIDGSVIDLVGTIEQAAPRQAFRGPGGGESSSEVAAFQAEGRVEAKLDLASPFPTSALVRSSLKMEIEEKGGTAPPSALAVESEVTVGGE
jgi:hypothetical protein